MRKFSDYVISCDYEKIKQLPSMSVLSNLYQAFKRPHLDYTDIIHEKFIKSL